MEQETVNQRDWVMWKKNSEPKRMNVMWKREQKSKEQVFDVEEERTRKTKCMQSKREHSEVKRIPEMWESKEQCKENVGDADGGETRLCRKGSHYFRFQRPSYQGFPEVAS